jgi:hypothetical protein
VSWLISDGKVSSHAEVCAQNAHGANGIVPTISAIAARESLGVHRRLGYRFRRIG